MLDTGCWIQDTRCGQTSWYISPTSFVFHLERFVCGPLPVLNSRSQQQSSFKGTLVF
ncbi:MAG: hypothetical protein JWM28_392 [Chitinophagaceae bacterium]|nr:hypothetical protein [Chitinophagaceae bacterium]